MDLAPELQPGTYVFCVDDGRSKVSPVATIREREGLTIVLAREDADAAGLGYDLVLAWITLGAETSLDEVGITARFSAALARAGIACNVVAGRRHDHLFVPAHRGTEALALLRGLGESRSRLVRSYLERAVNRRDASAVDDLVAEDYRGSGHGWPADRDALRAFYEHQSRERPDWRIDVVEAIESGEWVAVSARAGGDIPEPRKVEWLALYRVTDGRIAEIRVVDLQG